MPADQQCKIREQYRGVRARFVGRGYCLCVGLQVSAEAAEAGQKEVGRAVHMHTGVRVDSAGQTLHGKSPFCDGKHRFSQQLKSNLLVAFAVAVVIAVVTVTAVTAVAAVVAVVVVVVVGCCWWCWW